MERAGKGQDFDSCTNENLGWRGREGKALAVAVRVAVFRKRWCFSASVIVSYDLLSIGIIRFRLSGSLFMARGFDSFTMLWL